MIIFNDENKTVEYYSDGKKFREKIFHEGSSKETWIQYYEDGNVSDVITFENGKQTSATSYRTDGKTKETEMEFWDDKGTNKITFYDKNGNFEDEVYHIKGYPVSKEEYEQAIESAKIKNSADDEKDF